MCKVPFTCVLKSEKIYIIQYLNTSNSKMNKIVSYIFLRKSPRILLKYISPMNRESTNDISLEWVIKLGTTQESCGKKFIEETFQWQLCC